MLTHHHDHTCSLQSSCAPLLQRAIQGYFAEVPAQPLDEQSRLIEQLIGLAFDTLGARYLELRVSGVALDATAITRPNQGGSWGTIGGVACCVGRPSLQ